MSEQHQLPLAPVGWEWTALGEVCFLNPWWWNFELTDDDVVSFVPMAAVEEETGHLDVSIVRKWKEVRQGYTRFQENDVLFAKITPSMENGKAALAVNLVQGRGVGSTEFHVLRPTSGVLPKQILYFVLQKQFREAARRVMKGVAGQLRVPPEFVAQSVFPLPPRNEQQRIVDEIEKQFSRLDAAVEMLQRVERNLEHLRAATLKAAVEGRLVPSEAELARAEGRDYEPADVLLQRSLRERRAKWEADRIAKMEEQGKTPQDDKWKAEYEEPDLPDTVDLPEISEGWVLTTLKSIAEIKGGITKGQQRRSTDSLRTVPYLRVANVQRGYLDLREIKTIEATEAEIEGLVLLSGDILFTEGGDRDKLGRGWIWRNEIPECIHQNHVFRARLYLDQIQPKYISWYGNTYGQDYFTKQGKQTTNLASINITKLGAFPIPLPPSAEQSRIVAEVERRISVIEELKTLVTNALRRAAILRQKILREAFAGKLVPQDPADEPARILLERIRVEKAEREAEALQARKERRGKMKGSKAKPSTRKPRRSLRDVVAESKRRLTPEQLFAEAGFTPEVIEVFYEELRSEIEDRHIEQVRPDSAKVYLIAAANT